MQNLAQVRAKNALSAAPGIGSGQGDGKSVAKKVPAQIIQNGILGALAFAIETQAGYLDVFNAVCVHLRSPELAALRISPSSPNALFDALSNASSDTLRAVTAETLEYLNYFRRFANGDKDSNA
ncbi:MAG: type III-B CRISPR module-associated protein Cmr5 [Kiritimatiellae bacterium]|nr:type III-B CRISPR module-associated protein Cmr5 [Kiritimatiellia bacterium]